MAQRGGKGKRGGLSGQQLREFRSNVSRLKRLGIVSARVDARKQRATRYMRSKVKHNMDVLEGNAIALKATREVRRKYKDNGIFETRGKTIIVPKERHGETARIRKGLVEITSPQRTTIGLPYMEAVRVVLPYSPRTMQQLVEGLDRHPELEELAGPGTGVQWFFRIYGHNSNIPFLSLNNPENSVNDDLRQYLTVKYAHLFTKSQTAKSVKHFELFRYRGYFTEMPQAPEHGKIINEGPGRNPKKGRRIDATGRNSGRTKRREATKDELLSSWRKLENERATERKTSYRRNETEEKRAKRLKEQRERSRRNRLAKKGKKK